MSFDLKIVTANEDGIVNSESLQVVSYSAAAAALLNRAAPYALTGYGAVATKSYEWEVWKRKPGSESISEFFRFYIADANGQPLDQVALKPHQLTEARAALDLQVKGLKQLVPYGGASFDAAMSGLCQRCDKLVRLVLQERNPETAARLSDGESLFEQALVAFEEVESAIAVPAAICNLVERQRAALSLQASTIIALAKRYFLEQTGVCY
ncbi:MAG: hypothetical protein K2W82_17715 [Candidatus Obscuribacterales bacterium]|nr:hypothetical protein [Candidatus Obscuribacterales bacterium]